jgi:phage/plasmid-associated DNA primase
MFHEWKIDLAPQDVHNFVRDHIKAQRKQDAWDERDESETEYENEFKQECEKSFVSRMSWPCLG